MDKYKHIPISGNLFLIPVPWSGFLCYKLLYSCVSRDDAFYLVRTLRTLNFGYFNQMIKHRRLLFQVEFLSTFKLMNLSKQSNNFIVPLDIFERGIIKISHIGMPPYLPNCTIFGR